eukprot:365084-Chlamydomonas_euryale.AAC.5
MLPYLKVEQPAPQRVVWVLFWPDVWQQHSLRVQLGYLPAARGAWDVSVWSVGGGMKLGVWSARGMGCGVSGGA